MKEFPAPNERLAFVLARYESSVFRLAENYASTSACGKFMRGRNVAILCRVASLVYILTVASPFCIAIVPVRTISFMP